MARKIVVIDDEADIRAVVLYNLAREGFEVLCAEDGTAGLALARRERPDAVLLDLMLPDIDGIEVCRRLRSDPVTRDVPVIMLTAKGEEADVVIGLGVGADDYVTKPFSARELVARVQALLRRAPRVGPSSSGDRLVHHGITIDPDRHEVRVDGTPVEFTATEFRLLHALASNPGRVFTRDQLVHRAIGEDANVVGRTIDVHIRSLRQKLGGRRELIETIRGVGYRLREAPPGG